MWLLGDHGRLIKWHPLVNFQFVYVILNGQNFLDPIEDYCLTKLNYNEYH